MRAKAKDEISRKFPPHYDRVIDEFTKNQANRAAASGK
jgi:hypothetical protein